MMLYHYTNKDGFNGIRSAKTWVFVASEPPCEHPKGAYFTDLDERTPRLALRLRIGSDKIRYMFKFRSIGDLEQIEGGRGRHIFFSRTDYEVEKFRQEDCREVES